MLRIRLLIALAAAALLAGCMSAPMERRQASLPSGVEGMWVDEQGNRSSFAGGRFETIAADTGAKLSDGSYRYADARTVAIEVRSLIRQSIINVNCALVSPSQLNCTSSTGNRFVLVRAPSAV